MNLDIAAADKIIENALFEDIGDGDITTNSLIDEKEVRLGYLKVKEDGILAGLPIAFHVFRKLDPKFSGITKADEGDKVKTGTIVAELHGTLRALLTGERTALNLLQRMSGIATKTFIFVNEIKHTKAKILDTRKTVPGLRIFDKYAVKVGGGANHRMGLYDMVMIKDNHIKAAGSIYRAVDLVKAKIKPGIKIEVETSNIKEVNEALEAEVDIIMLDNMSVELMNEAVKLINGKAKVEASGNITIKNVKAVAETGIDFISVGALTHSVKALDIGQYLF